MPEKLKMLSGTDAYKAWYVAEAKTFIAGALEQTYYTPDSAKLQTHNEHDVFIPGSMKKGFSREDFLEKLKCHGIGYTNSSLFKMYRLESKNIQPEAVLFINSSQQDCGRVYGEVYRVPTTDILKLDFMWENGTKYRRIKLPIRVSIPNHTDNAVVHPCWVYVAIQSFWKDRMDKLTLCDLLTPNKDPSKKYYSFMRKYEDDWYQRYDAA